MKVINFNKVLWILNRFVQTSLTDSEKAFEVKKLGSLIFKNTE